jgi:restriction system-associated AAA family ATPase
MKLIRIKLPNTRFRGLQKGFEINFNAEEIDNIDTLYFTGQNGSGKSNLLELISEIFYYLDSLELKHGAVSLQKEKNISFEIEYKIQAYTIDAGEGFSFGNFIIKENMKSWIHVKMVKTEKQKPKYFIKYPNGKDFPLAFNTLDERVAETVKNTILPRKIIGYTSGQNELLSNAFLRMRYHYFNEYDEIQKQREDEDKLVSDSLSNSRLMLLDYRNNSAMLISSLLFEDSKSSEILKSTYKELLDIEDIYSFRININFKALSDAEYPESIRLSHRLNEFIEKIKRCTPFYFDNDELLKIDEKYKRQVLLDFRVTKATKEAFRSIFENSKTLFEFFYEMEILNIYAQDATVRDTIVNAPKDFNVRDKIATLDPENLIFNISLVNIQKTGFDYPIKYKNLSDGEHQFLQVIGAMSMMKDDNCLFLLDEPATHLNPAWAIQYFKHIDNCRSEYGSSQILLTTHDPLMVGPLSKEQVKIFKKEDQNVITMEPLTSPQGMGVSGLLKSDIFGLSSVVDIETTKKLQNRNELYSKKQLLKKEGKDLTESENDELSRLSNELSSLGFSMDFKDPFYAKFIERMAGRVKFTKPQVSIEEQLSQNQIADEIIDDLLSEVEE